MVKVCPLPESWTTSDVKTIKTSHKWTINKFSKCLPNTGEHLKSSKFCAEEDPTTKWCLYLYPEGNTEVEEDFISIYLNLVSSKDNQMRAEFKIGIIGDNNQIYSQLESNKRFKVGIHGWGWGQFIGRTELENLDQLLLPNGCLTIYCEVSTFMSITSSGRKISLKRRKTMADDMTGFYQNLSDGDFEIIVENHKFIAHKFLLMARSPYFEAMFRQQTIEKMENRIVIQDMKKEVFNSVLRFMYTDKYEAKDILFTVNVFFAADMYHLVDLKSICEQYIELQMTVETVSDILVLAEVNSSKELKTRAIDFIKRNYSEVTKTQGWVDVIKRPDLLKDISFSER